METTPRSRARQFAKMPEQLCTRCKKREPRYGRKMCAACLDYYAQRRAVGRVRTRKEILDGMARNRRIYWERKLDGLCTRCGKASAGEATLECDRCAILKRDRMRIPRRKAYRRKARVPRKRYRV